MSKNPHLTRLLHIDEIYPGHPLPPRPGEDRPALSPFGRLAMGQLLGKSSILIYDGDTSGVQQSAVDMITVEGDDLDATQLVLTLQPPRVIPIAFDAVERVLAQQNLTGEQTNAEITAGNFPGSSEAIRWPPLEAQIVFGTGGVNTSVAVDYVNGVTVSVVASFLRVRAIVTQSKDNGSVYGTSAAYYLAANVGPGFAEAHAQRTIFVGSLAADASSDVLDVPRFAKLAMLCGWRTGSPQLPAGWIRFFQDPQGLYGVGDFFLSGSSRIEVPNGAMYFSIVNGSGLTLNMSTIFELAI